MHIAGVCYADAVRQFKNRYILAVLAHHKGHQGKAADELGVHRNTLSRTLAEPQGRRSPDRQWLAPPGGKRERTRIK